MRKPTKQDFIFIWKILLFILVTFKVYLLVRQHFIIDNCTPISLSLWGPQYVCLWYLKFFNEYSILFYILFLWITIVPYMRRKYPFPSNTIFVAWIIVLVLLLIYIYIYRITPTVFLDNLSTWKQVTPLENLWTWETWFSHK
jgi:hypothetical protein